MKPRLPNMLVALAALHHAMATNPQQFRGQSLYRPQPPRAPEDPTFGLVKKDDPA